MPCPPPSTSAGNVLVVSSTTRPTGYDLYVGRYIFETDTLRSLVYDGTGWIIMGEPAQTSTTASFSGITGGTPSYTNEYHRSDGWVDFVNLVTFGSAPSGIASLSVLLPIASGPTLGVPMGVIQVGFRDTGVAVYPGMADVAAAGGSTVAIYAINAAGASAQFGVASTTVPFTFGTNDQIFATGRYRMTTRYS